MKHILFRVDESSAERLKKIKSINGINYTEAIKRGLFLLDKELATNKNELGKAYQNALIKKKNDKKKK